MRTFSLAASSFAGPPTNPCNRRGLNHKWPTFSQAII
jgi:hypothetical protein